jgi:hypothetical protein
MQHEPQGPLRLTGPLVLHATPSPLATRPSATETGLRPGSVSLWVRATGNNLSLRALAVGHFRHWSGTRQVLPGRSGPGARAGVGAYHARFPWGLHLFMSVVVLCSWHAARTDSARS